MGTATDFCSHVWKSSFQNFVESLAAEAAQRGSNEPRYYWNDIWVLDYTKPAPNYFETFRTAIPTIGRTMLVMGSLKNAKPLTRAWCVWEIFCTINAGCELAVVMPPSSRVELKHMLTHQFDDVIKILMSVKSEKSEARFQSDKNTIFQIIREECKGGFGGVDGVICEGLRGWLSSAALRLVSGVVEGEEVVEELVEEEMEGVVVEEEMEEVVERGRGKERQAGVEGDERGGGGRKGERGQWEEGRRERGGE